MKTCGRGPHEEPMRGTLEARGVHGPIVLEEDRDDRKQALMVQGPLNPIGSHWWRLMKSFSFELVEEIVSPMTTPFFFFYEHMVKKIHKQSVAIGPVGAWPHRVKKK